MIFSATVLFLVSLFLAHVSTSIICSRWKKGFLFPIRTKLMTLQTHWLALQTLWLALQTGWASSPLGWPSYHHHHHHLRCIHYCLRWTTTTASLPLMLRLDFHLTGGPSARSWTSDGAPRSRNLLAIWNERMCPQLYRSRYRCQLMTGLSSIFIPQRPNYQDNWSFHSKSIITVSKPVFMIFAMNARGRYLIFKCVRASI